jgi:two-component system NtrC family sensor kinase
MMSRFFFLAFFFCYSVAYGQSPKDSGFDLGQLPVEVTNQWKFHAGDNPAWAGTAFNDQNWQHLDPTQIQHFLPQVTNAQLGWFRLTLHVAPVLRGKVVALIVNQHGAAEIYFNGTLVRRMGRVSANYPAEQTRYSNDEPITVQLSSAPLQYLAIRYSFSKSNFIIGYGEPVIIASFNQADSAWDRFFVVVDLYTTRSWVSGCFLLLAIFQLAIYFFNRDRKTNLYLSVYAFLQLFTLWDGLLLPMLPGANWWWFLSAAFNISAPAEFVFLLAMSYDFFGIRRNWWFYTVAIFCVPVIIILFIGDNGNGYVLYIYNIISYLTITGISVKALKQRKAGAPLFLTGIIIALIFFILFVLSGRSLHLPFLLHYFGSTLAFLTPAIILAILLAREFAQNLISLRQKLAEVEGLSARSLQQELEKQEILARQNEMLEQKVTERTAELNQSLTELKTAQRQLIQSEKMASLGELTAGIAHEIQNPLNFVNNFSEVNKEMLEELKAESEKPKAERDGQLETDLINDLIENESKINHHGKRADSIVKGMLEHSKAGSGKKELTDINTLADEFMRLSYHGLRSKDKSFNSELVTHFDKKLPKIEVVPQDMGRVMLNLFNNAFYAVNQKLKTAGADYRPEVTVSTSAAKNNIIIKVKDNGNGIPDAIKDKIMQPFFTTKPTGEGTGLGLSLSYDIIVKGHGGKIDLNSTHGEGATFTITLPAENKP